MASIELDMIQTAGIGGLALIVGMVLTRKVAFLQNFCVPSPVSGGIIFSLITLVLYSWLDVEVSFDGTLKDVFMLAFFTSVGFHGLIAGSMIDGPLAERIIHTKLTHEQVQPQDEEIDPAMAGIESDEAAVTRNTIGYVSYKDDDGKWVKADKLLDMERIISVGNI